MYSVAMPMVITSLQNIRETVLISHAYNKVQEDLSVIFKVLLCSVS